MNAGVCNMHSTNYLLSKCFLCVGMRYTLPILWNVAFFTYITMQFHCIPQWYVLCFTCIFSNCCLQYASVLQVGIIFQAINWLLFFYIPEQKGPLLEVTAIKHTFATTQNTRPLHIYARQTITASCGIIARQCIIYYSVGFPPGKELALLEKSNQLSSESCDFLGFYAAWNRNS